MTTLYTTNLGLEKPDFRSPDWAGAIQRDLDAIDEAIHNVLMDVTPWANSVAVVIGEIRFDTTVNPFSYWICNVAHTTATTPTTFAQERAAHPTYWAAFSFGISPRGAWTNDTVYAKNDIAYDSVRGITGIARLAHTSNHAGSIQDDAASWDFIVNLPTVFTATATTYDDSVTGFGALNVQDAIEAIGAQVAGAYVSSNIAYDHTVSGMAATNVKTAIDELKAGLVAALALIAANTTAITTGTIATGFIQWRPTNEVLAGWVPLNGLSIGNAGSFATGRANADTQAAFVWVWTNFNDTECPVSGGRGGTALGDYALSKNIATPDMKGTGIVGHDTMGGSATTRLVGVPVISGAVNTAGSLLGENFHALSAAEHASHFHAVFAGVETHDHSIDVGSSGGGVDQVTQGIAGVGATITGPVNAAATNLTVRDTAGGGGTANRTAVQGSGTAHNNVARVRTGFFYLKL